MPAVFSNALMNGIRAALLTVFSVALNNGVMKLSEFFAMKRGAQASLAKALDVPAPLLSAWASENPETRRQVPAERCPLIERATKRAVRCEDLRPDIAWEVLRERPVEGGACV